MQFPISVGIVPTLGIRGVISESRIASGSIVEESPIILLPIEDVPFLDETMIANYKYGWNESFECIVLGYGSLYNHSYSPNVVYRRVFERKVMQYIALHDIESGEELTINYNGDPNDTTELDAAHLCFDRFVRAK